MLYDFTLAEVKLINNLEKAKDKLLEKECTELLTAQLRRLDNLIEQHKDLSTSDKKKTFIDKLVWHMTFTRNFYPMLKSFYEVGRGYLPEEAFQIIQVLVLEYQVNYYKFKTLYSDILS